MVLVVLGGSRLSFLVTCFLLKGPGPYVALREVWDLQGGLSRAQLWRGSEGKGFLDRVLQRFLSRSDQPTVRLTKPTDRPLIRPLSRTSGLKRTFVRFLSTLLAAVAIQRV